MALGWLLAGPAAWAQSSRPGGEDLEDLVRAGQTEVLEARIGKRPAVDEWRLLARAHANRARNTPAGEARVRAFEAAAEKYRAWIRACEQADPSVPRFHAVRLAAARVEYAGMLLSGPAAALLDEIEISAGRMGNADEARRLLRLACDEYQRALAGVRPLVENLRGNEEELLSAGIFDTLAHVRRDALLNGGWTNYYLGALEPQEEPRTAHFIAAERLLQELMQSRPPDDARIAACLVMGMAQRELGRVTDAERNLGVAIGKEAPVATAAQGRCELAKLLLRTGRFDEARTTLQPLVAGDPERRSSEVDAARFYCNLATLWDANSYLLEANATQAQPAADSTARAAIQQKARRTRDVGLARFRQLAARGGAWETLAQLYVAASIDERRSLAELRPLELVYAAAVLVRAGRFDAAVQRLQAAAQRPDVDRALAGDVAFQLAWCEHLRGNERAAAAAFQAVAAQHRDHARAPEAATHAMALWGQIADSSRAPDDYLALVAVLRNLLETFPRHPQHAEAAWLLPVVLERAGRHLEAAEEFTKVPRESPHWEEAQYRRVLCQRLALDTAAAAREAPASRPAGETKARTELVAKALLRYADEARQRADNTPGPDRAAMLRWSAAARLDGAELLVTPPLEEFQEALSALEGLDSSAVETSVLARALAVRIRAYRGLRDFERATATLRQYLERAPSGEIGGTLAALARDLQEEVERLAAAGRTDAARVLATDALPTFDELSRWVRAEPGRRGALEAVLAGQARMLYLAGQYAAAGTALDELLSLNPGEARYAHLKAAILFARLAPDAPTSAIQAAQDAWSALLRDGNLRQRDPEAYWEARYHWLVLELRRGNAAAVEQAVEQERIWQPGLGGAIWADKLGDLWRAARRARGLPADWPPTSSRATGAAVLP